MMIMLSFVLMTGLMSVQVPLATAAEDNSATQAFENIDYVKAPYIRVILGGKQIAFDVDPQIVQSRTLVPMRTMFETFGLTVNWDETTKTAQGISSDSAISLTIGSNKALFNGQELIMGVPASIIQGRTMIPLRFFSENMGYKVVWVQASNLILISKSDIIEWRYDGFEELAPYKEFESKYINGLKLEERRYSGINYEVIIYDLYSKDGRFIPNVPDFKIANYGTGWYKQSPFSGNTYWVDIDTVAGMYGNSKFFNFDDFSSIKAGMLRESAPVGNYIKIKIEEHGFNLETWNKIAFSSESALSIIEDEQLLDGKIINNYDTIFKVTINDKFSGYMTRDAFLGTLLKPEANKIYNILVKDPKIMFNWEDSLWSRLKGEIPWAGMTKDMFLVQRQSKPDKMTELVTKFSKLELWVYQSQYTDSIYYFDNEILTGMW